MEVLGSGLGLPSGGVVEIKNLAVQQGTTLDTKYMRANVEEEIVSKPCWKLVVTFKDMDGRSIRLSS